MTTKASLRCVRELVSQRLAPGVFLEDDDDEEVDDDDDDGPTDGYSPGDAAAAPEEEGEEEEDSDDDGDSFHSYGQEEYEKDCHHG